MGPPGTQFDTKLHILTQDFKFLPQKCTTKNISTIKENSSKNHKKNHKNHKKIHKIIKKIQKTSNSFKKTRRNPVSNKKNPQNHKNHVQTLENLQNFTKQKNLQFQTLLSFQSPEIHTFKQKKQIHTKLTKIRTFINNFTKNTQILGKTIEFNQNPRKNHRIHHRNHKNP